MGAFVLDRRWGIAQGFDRFFDDFDLEKYGEARGHGRDPAAGRGGRGPGARMAAARSASGPSSPGCTSTIPHTPYEAPEPFRSRFPRTPSGAYDAEIAATDAQVGRLLDALERDGRLGETLVVVVGDHGEMLGEHGEQTHGFFIYDAAVRIPLIVAGPGVPGREVADQVRIVDVMPTVLELLGVPGPKAVQGTSLLPLARGERLGLVAHSESWYPRYHYGWSELQSVQDGRFKYIRAPRPELYDLAADPGEIEGPLGRRTPRASRASSRRSTSLLARTDERLRGQGPADRGRGDRGAAGRARLRGGRRRAPRTSRSGRAAIPRTRSGSTTC